MADQTIHQAYVAALADLANPKKNQTADTGRFAYSYADLAQVIDLTRPALAAHGLVAVQDVQMSEGQLYVWTYVMHVSGEQLTFGPIVGRPSADWQQLGAAVTYARRYSLMAALGLAAEGEDTDALVAGEPVKNHEKPKPKPKPDSKQQGWERMDPTTAVAPAYQGEPDPWQTPEPELGSNAAQALVEAELGGVVLVPNNVTGPLARKMVRDGSEPATEKQLWLVRKLAQEKADELGHEPIAVVNAYLADAGLAQVEKTADMTKGQASAFIEAVKA